MRIPSYEPECHIADVHRHPKESRNRHSFELAMQAGRGRRRGQKLQLDDPSLHANHGCVGSIVGAQLGKDGLDSTLNRFFSNGKLIRDLLVGVARGDQSQHSDFRRRQRIIRGMLGDFVRGFGRKRFFSAMNGSDRFYQFLVKRGFQQVP